MASNAPAVLPVKQGDSTVVVIVPAGMTVKFLCADRADIVVDEFCPDDSVYVCTRRQLREIIRKAEEGLHQALPK